MVSQVCLRENSVAYGVQDDGEGRDQREGAYWSHPLLVALRDFQP